jgi:Putative Tad-like Flp pilus-assembly
MSLQLAVILVPVVFGFLGFALDLGRLYLIRGELNQAANAMAVQAASQLLGTAASATNVQNIVASTTGPSYFYNFGTIQVGTGRGNLTSTINTPTCFATAADATSSTGQAADCGSAQAVQVSVTADAPLLFFSLLPGGESRKTPIAASAVAGVSAPLCTACGIVPLAVAALDSSDTANFGFDSSFATLYTLSQQCTGNPAPINLTGTSSIGPAPLTTVPYVLINRYDTANTTLDEYDQAYVAGANGVAASANATPNALTSNTNTPVACMNMSDSEQLWATAAPPTCANATPQTTQAILCGIYSRLDNLNPPSACTTVVTDYSSLSASYLPDTDLVANETPPYSAYTGNGRRIITVAIVDALAANTSAAMTVLGFRQFLVVPNTDGSFFTPSDQNGRFPVLYIGNPAPLQSGWFDTRYANSCPVGSFSGPGKVVLHR